MWSSFKQFLPANQDKCVIVEDGELRYVIVSFAEYQQLKKAAKCSTLGARSKDEKEDVWDEDAVNRTIEELEHKEFEAVKIEKQPEGRGRGLAGISIEDLPF